MNIQRLLKNFLILYPPFVILDFVWFGFLVSPIYQKHLSHLMLPPESCTLLTFVGMFVPLALIVLGALLFVAPRVSAASYVQSFIWGAVYGFITYGIYSISNLIHLNGWPIQITLLDISWGMAVCGLLGVCIAYLSKQR